MADGGSGAFQHMYGVVSTFVGVRLEMRRRYAHGRAVSPTHPFSPGQIPRAPKLPSRGRPATVWGRAHSGPGASTLSMAVHLLRRLTVPTSLPAPYAAPQAQGGQKHTQIETGALVEPACSKIICAIALRVHCILPHKWPCTNGG